MKKALLLALCLLMALAFVPGSSRASHCGGLFIFSGPNAVVSNAVSPGANAGAVGCDAEAAGDPNTNYLAPGADALRVGADGAATQQPTLGKISFNGGAETNITFTWEPTRGRWLSNLVSIPASATSVKATAKVFTGSAFTNEKTTYTKLV
jgi:hypothetical protein